MTATNAKAAGEVMVAATQVFLDRLFQRIEMGSDVGIDSNNGRPVHPGQETGGLHPPMAPAAADGKVYEQVHDDQWWLFQDGKSNRRAKIACPDCGLVHQFKIKIRDGKVFMQIVRLERETAGRRRHAS
jgi:hypothetical protein